VNATTASYNICTGSCGLLYQFAALVGHTLPSTIGLITPLFGNILDISIIVIVGAMPIKV
jgi:hypothetical protein